MEEKTQVYQGNLFWLILVKKKVNKENNFSINFHSKAIKEARSKTISMYESIVFNEDKEDSLFYQIGNDMFEYFNHDKFDLFYKLMRIYENKYFEKSKNETTKSTYGMKPYYKLRKNVETSDEKTMNISFSSHMLKAIIKTTDKLKQDISEQIINKPMSVLSTEKIMGRQAKDGEVIANVLIMYKDKSRAWIPNFEVKKIPFYWKFFPNYENIRLIQLYPYTMEKIDSIIVSYDNKDEEFDEKNNNYKKLKMRGRKPEYEIYESYIKEIKELFLNKYDLYLKSVKLELVKINHDLYLIDVEEIIFDKYNNKDPKMKFENVITSFKEKHIDKNLRLTKETANVEEIKELIETMRSVFEDKIINKCGVQKYLKPPDKDSKSDDAFKVLKEDCPYQFSELLSDKVDKKTFLKYCSNKIIKY